MSSAASGLAVELGNLLGVEWARPLVLLGALLALLVLFAGLIRSKPRVRPLGTTQLWRDLLRENSQVQASDRLKRRFPLHLFCLAASLVGVSIAMAGPRWKEPPRPRQFTVFVDNQPAMQLPVRAGGETRAAKARASFDRWRETVSEPDVEFEFRQGVPPGGGARGDIVLTGEATPWLEAPVGLFASGGEAAPGAIGWGVGEGGEALVYSLDLRGDVVAMERSHRAVVVAAGKIPRAIREVFQAWAEERGLEVLERPQEVSPAEASPAEALLLLAGPAGSASSSFAGGLDGWSARGPAIALRAEGAVTPREAEDTPWVQGANGEVLVSFSPGEIRVGWSSFEERSGPNADFALSWARLFDRTLREPPGVIAARDRRSAGEALVREPDLEDARRGTIARQAALPLDLWVGGVAFVLAILSAVLRRVGRPQHGARS